MTFRFTQTNSLSRYMAPELRKDIRLLYIDDACLPELIYLCRLFSALLQVNMAPCHLAAFDPRQAFAIGYCSHEVDAQLPLECKIRIHSDTNFWKSYLQKVLPEIFVNEDNGVKALNSKKPSAYLLRNDNGLVTNIDLFASAFFIISGLEEIYTPQLRDNHGRFLFAHSKWAKHYVDEPLVNSHARILMQWLQEVYALETQTDPQFSAILSHDIDSPYFYGTFRSEISELITFFTFKGKYKSLSDIKNYFSCLVGQRLDPHDTFGYIQEQEQKRGIPGTYFILLSKDNAWGMNRKKYSKTLRNILSAGNEIALHPGYDSLKDPQTISREKCDLEDLVNTRIQGVRNHFLRFDLPCTYRLISDLGISYDATMGFPDREGFRHGICTPFKPFDVKRRAMVDVMEIPLVVMDGTLREYRNYSPQQAIDAIVRLIRVTSSYCGTIVFNWHNSFLTEQNRKWRNVYEQSLDSLVEQYADFFTCDQIANSYRNFW